MFNRRVRGLMAVLFVICVTCAAAASAAQAETEGPYYLVEEELLGSGQAQEITATDKTAFVFTSKTAKVKVECKAVKVKSGAVLNGSEGKTSGGGSEILELSECKGGATEESLSGCEPEGGKVTSAALVDAVGYATSSRTGAILVLFKPESGTKLATIKFTGTKCVTTSAVLTGNFIGEAYSGGSAIEVGSNEVEAVKGELRFGTAEKTIWTESGGSLTSVKSGLQIAEVSATLEGQEVLELASKQAWGPFSQIELHKRAYSFGPSSVLFMEVAGEEQSFTLDDRGSEDLELRNLKIGGGDASDYEITDVSLCALKTLVTLGHCEVSIKLLVANAGDATFEGEVLFGGTGSGPHHAFRVKALVND